MSAVRAAYTALIFLAAPFAALYLLWRSRRQPEYRSHWAERFGVARWSTDRAQPLIWLHAVSVGETMAAAPLIAALADHYPAHNFLLTHMTPTGRAAGAALSARWPGRVVQSYLPYDLPYAVRRFLRAFQPLVGISLETEAWPNLVASAVQQSVPMVLVNARLSEASYRASRRYASLMRETAARFSIVLAQSDADAARIRKVGAPRVESVGNMKFDFTPDPAMVERGRVWRSSLARRPVLLFASTREGEEAMLLTALPRNLCSRATVIIVPRHPQRFDDVARLIEAHGTPFVRCSQPDFESRSDAAFFLGDSMGEMPVYYAAADVAFIGGSLLELGGQNLIEACAVGTPVVVGPHTFNFAQATEDAIAAGAAVRAGDAAEAFATMTDIADSPLRRQHMSEAASYFAAAHRGATARTLERLTPFIDAASASRAAAGSALPAVSAR
ncbi:MAG: lipid IV(A) 3-deoxy-D-manno-octulosonic acid transferase [Pseudomonadota bacterium]|nr:lipid IV(A) 3-deoxy-D-manno-octulosonic acid transferase [Pseudomonadota bacterium]